MSQQKYHKEHSDRTPLTGVARAVTVLCVVNIVFAVGLHLATYIANSLLVGVGVVALASAVLSAYMWERSKVFRVIVRTLLLTVALLIVGFGVFSAVFASSYNPESSPLDNWELYGSFAVQFLQLITVFFLPTWVAAASSGAKFDRVCLTVFSFVNAIAVAFLTYYVSQSMGLFAFTLSSPVVQLLYVLFAFVIAVLTLIPSLGSRKA